MIRLQRLREEERQRDEEFDRMRVAQARASQLLEREEARRKEAIARQLKEENQRLAREQKAHQEYLNKDVYTNDPTAAYFMQFNTTTR